MNPILVGVGRCDITPAPGTPQGGWGAQTHQRGLGADLPLYATAFVISNTETSAAIIDVDSIGFDLEWTERITQAVVGITQIPRENIILSCTHTHSGPNTFRLSTIREGLDMVLGYMRDLPGRIAGAAWQAQQNLRQVRSLAGEGQCKININRRLRLPNGRLAVGKNPDGPVDHTVRVVQFDDLDASPVATIVHYACHPTIMGWQNQYFTPDFPGIVRQVVEQQVGGTCLFLQGAAEDIVPIRGFTGNLEVYRHLGKLLGLEASKVAIGLQTFGGEEKPVEVIESSAAIARYEKRTPECSHSLQVLNWPVKLPLKPFRPLVEYEMKATTALEEFDRLNSAAAPAEQLRAARANAVQAGDRLRMAKSYFGKSHIPWHLQAIALASWVLLAFPGKPFCRINQLIVEKSPFPHTIFACYVNGGEVYLPDRESYDPKSYEVELSPFAKESAEILVREAVQMLRDLATHRK